MSSEIKVDTISEKTSANGVVIDGVTLKDSKIGGTITIPGSTGTMALTSDIPASGGITNLQEFRLSANLTSNAQIITANLEENDNDTYQPIGSIVSQSSGVFTFSATGKYIINLLYNSYSPSGAYHNGQIRVNDGDGTFDMVARANGGASGVEASAFTSAFVDITSTNFEVHIYKSTNNGSSVTYGDSNGNKTSIQFIRIGDT